MIKIILENQLALLWDRKLLKNLVENLQNNTHFFAIVVITAIIIIIIIIFMNIFMNFSVRNSRKQPPEVFSKKIYS